MQIKLENSIQEQIKAVETRMLEQLIGNPSALVATLEQRIITGGNRIRPTLTLLIGRMLEVDREALLNLAASIEMLHTATLVHDDLIDTAASRRGQKTLNASFSTSATVLAGDLAFAAAANLAAATSSVAVMKMFSKTLQFLVNGEITYLFSNGTRGDRESYFKWVHAKTASIFEMAAGAAATLGSADADTVTIASKFGDGIGMAFQLGDDVLDFTGDQAALGKPAAGDLRQGIITLPTIYYLETHPHDPDIRSIINRNGHSPDTLEHVIAAICHSEAIQQSFDEAKAYLQRGLDALAELPDTLERQELEGLAMQMVHREM